jgi:hypothetical protein
MKPTMNNLGSDGRLEVSFTFQPRNKRGNVNPQSDSRRGSTGKGNIPRVAKLLALAIYTSPQILDTPLRWTVPPLSE